MANTCFIYMYIQLAYIISLLLLLLLLILINHTIHSISFNLYYSYGLLGAFDHIYMLICALEILNIIIIIFVILPARNIGWACAARFPKPLAYLTYNQFPSSEQY